MRIVIDYVHEWINLEKMLLFYIDKTWRIQWQYVRLHWYNEDDSSDKAPTATILFISLKIWNSWILAKTYFREEKITSSQVLENDNFLSVLELFV